MSKIFTKPFRPLDWAASPHDFTGDNILGLYSNETTQRFIPGTRSILWDGRVFKYSKAGAANIGSTDRGAKNDTSLVACKETGTDQNYVTVPTVAIGLREVTVTFTVETLGDSTSGTYAAKTGVVLEDELAGGYISFSTGSYPAIVTQTRGILGHTAVTATDTSMTVYLDAPIDSDLTTGESTAEILANPYSNLVTANNGLSSVMGMPNCAAVSTEYLWVQTWGPRKILPNGAALGLVTQQRQFVFDDQGALLQANLAATMTAADAYQHAGFMIEKINGVAGQAAPFIMLQLST